MVPRNNVPTSLSLNIATVCYLIECKISLAFEGQVECRSRQINSPFSPALAAVQKHARIQLLSPSVLSPLRKWVQFWVRHTSDRQIIYTSSVSTWCRSFKACMGNIFPILYDIYDLNDLWYLYHLAQGGSRGICMIYSSSMCFLCWIFGIDRSCTNSHSGRWWTAWCSTCR